MASVVRPAVVELKTMSISKSKTEEVTSNILDMGQAERTQLFKEMNNLVTKTGFFVLPINFWKRMVKIVGEGMEGERDLLNLLEKSWNKLAKFGKGPKARSQKAQERREIIMKLLQEGEVGAGKIRRSLDERGFKVKLKTIQNDISIIRRGP